MYKQSRYLVYLIFIFSITSYCQQRTLVFNNEGRIIKNYGYDSNHEIKKNINFLIENPEKGYTYYLLYEWRNEYNHSANIIENIKLNVKKFEADGILKLIDPRKVDIPNERYMNFILLRANTKGAEKLKDEKKITLKEILTAEKITLSSQNIITLFPLWENLKDNQDKKGNKFRTPKEIREQNKKIQKLEKQIEVANLALDKLGMIDEAEETPNKIIELQVKLNDLELILIEEKSNKSIAEANQKAFDTRVDNEILKAERQITTILSKVQQDSLAYYNLLHLGILIAKNNSVKEIVYDAHKTKLLDSNKELLRVARLTPNLPQLTTDSELYSHIINLNPDDLKENPFSIFMEAEFSEPVDAEESPNNLRSLQPIDLGFSEGIFQNNEASFSDSNNISKDIENLKKLSNNVLNKNIITLEQKEKLGGYILGIKDPFKTDFLTKFETLQDSEIQEWKLLIDDVRNWYINIEKKSAEFIEDLKKYLPKTNFTPIAYSEYILKYGKPFRARRRPTIRLFSKQYVAENYSQKVEKGKVEDSSYELKRENVELIKDELPAVHRLFRFSVSAGVLLTNSVSYNYELVPLANSSINDLIETRETSLDFRPSITFSTYILKQDLAVNVPIKRFYESAHIDVSIDYADSEILDNVYLGIGFEPLRNLQVSFGARFGEVDRISPENFNPTLPLSEQNFSSELNIGFYFSLSLAYDLIPKFYNLIFN